EATPYTDGVRDSLAIMRAVVPSLWPLEVVNATIMGERRKRLDEARSRRFFVLLEGLPIVPDGETGNRAFADIVPLARSYQLSALAPRPPGAAHPPGPAAGVSRRQTEDARRCRWRHAVQPALKGRVAFASRLPGYSRPRHAATVRLSPSSNGTTGR